MKTVSVTHKNWTRTFEVDESLEITDKTLKELLNMHSAEIQLSMETDNAVCYLSSISRDNDIYYKIPEDCNEFFLELVASLIIKLMASWTPYPNEFKKWCYYMNTNDGYSSVVVIHPHYFATFRHGRHKEYKIDDTIIAKHVDRPGDAISAKVAYIDEIDDFMLLHSSQQIIEKAPPLYYAPHIQRFSTGVFTSELQKCSYGKMEKGDYPRVYLNDGKGNERMYVNGRDRFTYCEGAGCFTSIGLMGMFTDPLPNDEKQRSSAVMLGATELEDALTKLVPELNKPPPPQQYTVIPPPGPVIPKKMPRYTVPQYRL